MEHRGHIMSVVWIAKSSRTYEARPLTDMESSTDKARLVWWQVAAETLRWHLCGRHNKCSECVEDGLLGFGGEGQDRLASLMLKLCEIRRAPDPGGQEQEVLRHLTDVLLAG
jgi:hypothetical protein